MIKKIIESYKNLEKKSLDILKKGLQFCFALCIISTLILFTYNLFLGSPNFYNIGILLFQSSIIFGVEFLVCALVVDSIKKHAI